MADPKGNGEPKINLAAALGAEPGTSIQCIRIYVPDKDRHGKEYGAQRMWVLEALELLTELNGGATAEPQVEGTWRSDTGAVVWERPVIVYSYVEINQFIGSLPRVREFLHRMGRQTDQGEVAFEFDDRFYRIQQFDPEEKP